MSSSKKSVVSDGAEVQTPDEKFEAIRSLTQKIEEKFIELGNVLSNIRRAKLYRFLGYERFKDFIEAEYAFSSSLAAKLVKVFESFVEDMDQDEETLKEIGFDKLCSILPMMKDADWQAKEDWLKQAGELPVKDLKESIKAARTASREEAGIDLKQTMVQQYQERMTTWFNCSLKELQFKLALYFQDFTERDLELMKKDIREKQSKFEMEASNAGTN